MNFTNNTPISESPQKYSIQVVLPESSQRQLREWVELTPGATLPSWGAHITLLPDFVPEASFDTIVQKVNEACAGLGRFVVQLDRVICDDFWLDWRLKAVLLVISDRSSDGYRKLVRLHDALDKALAPLRRDVQSEMHRRSYVPHVSLTSGLPKSEAERLAERARASNLQIGFVVEEITLLEVVASPGVEGMRPVRSFSLV